MSDDLLSNKNIISEYDELSYLKDFEDHFLDPAEINNLKFAK